MKYPLLISSIVVSAIIIATPVVFSDEDRDEYRQRSVGVAQVSLPLYQQECGSCHMAYPPGLLPERSWNKIMTGLESHFGDNAEIDTESFNKITEFLASNSADKSSYRRSKKIMRSINTDDSPIRISETPYFKKEHDEIPEKLVKFNQEVKSLANCNACHSKAEKGLFSEKDIQIPGYGRWDD